jgi:hypothetical protein
MKLDELIAAADEGPISDSMVTDAAAAAGASISEAIDLLARRVTDRFMGHELSYESADAVMNHLVAFAHSRPPFETPAYAWQVFLAFDAGETLLPGRPPTEQGETLTRTLLKPLVNEEGV